MRALRSWISATVGVLLLATPVLMAPSAGAVPRLPFPYPDSAASAAGNEANVAKKKMQQLTVTKTKKGLKVAGAKNLRAGHVRLVVKGKGDASISVVRFAKGYDFKKFTKDYNASNEGDMKALKRIFAKTDFLGGLEPGATGTITLPKKGKYTVFWFGEKVQYPTVIKAGKPKKSKAPKTDGKILAKKGNVWAGDDHLPTAGALAFNNGSDQPHHLIMLGVEEGTTTQDVLDYLSEEPTGPPPWATEGSLYADVISPGRKMTVDYDLPAGQYVLLCFIPDPSMDGMPHAMMGMIKMVHLM